MKHYYTTLKVFLLFSLVFNLTAFKSHATFTYLTTRLTTSYTDSTGLFVRLSVPYTTNTPQRYSCGAPIVIYVNGGFGSSGSLGSMFTMSNFGFIVCEFNFPGGGTGISKSGGVFDNRGANSMKAIHDVIKYCLGLSVDKNGKYLHEITGAITPLYNNVGVIGGSNGGCNLLAALGLHSNDLSTLAWISFFESPIGDGLLTADPGKPYGHSVLMFQNPGYNDSTNTFDWTKFKYSSNYVLKISGHDTTKGQFYFDLNGNNIFEPGIDYDIVGRTNTPYDKRTYYSQQIVQHAYQMGYYPIANPLSVHFADSTQTKSYWNLRNGDKWIQEFMPHIPNLKVLFMVRDDSDHITSAKNHPEVLNTWNKFSENGCTWFRVNSDKSYIENVTGQTLPTAPDNDANVVLNSLNIRSMVMPGNIFSNRYMNHYACSEEMADRVMNNNWSLNLSGILSSTCPVVNAKIEEVESDVQPMLYPNPANSEAYIQINANDFGSSTVRIFDAIGREVMQPQINDVAKGFNLLILNTNNLSAGNYFVRIEAPGVTHTLQFTRE